MKTITERDLEMLAQLFTKREMKEIATELGLEIGTAKSRSLRLYKKLGVEGRLEIMATRIQDLEMEIKDLRSETSTSNKNDKS